MQARKRNARGRAESGFTLIEIMVALAILGSSLFILLDMHYNAVHIQERLEFEVKIRNLLAQAVGIAEVEIAAGTLKDTQEFGDRYPGYSYAFDAELVDGSTASSTKTKSSQALSTYPGLYDVLVTIQDPDKTSHELHFYCMSRDPQSALGGQGGNEGTPDAGGAGGGDGGTGGGAAGGGAG